MMYWVKLILLGALAFVLTASANCKNASYDVSYISDTEEKYCYDEDSFLENSNVCHAERTLNYLLQTRKIYASAAFCLSISSSKDNNNDKFVVPVINIQNNTTCIPRFITGSLSYINSHSRIIHSKSYYIFTLEKIII